MSKQTTSGEVSPYINARLEWNERYGSYISQAKNWRLMAMGCTIGLIISGIGNLIQSEQQKVVPYIVETNTYGEVVRTTPADQAHAPNDKEMKAALRNWIIGARTVYLDTRAEKAVVDATYAMTMPDSPANRTLGNYHKQNNPYERSKSKTVEVQVNAVVPVTDDTWRIEWTEITRQRSGKVTGTVNWEGTFTVLLAPPTDAETILMNPLGIYVRQFAWTPRI